MHRELLPELLLVGRTASSVMISPDCTTTLVRAHSSACLVISRVASIATTTLSEKSRPTPILRPLLKFDLWWLLLLCWGLLHVDDTMASSRLPLEHALLGRLLIASGANEHSEYSTMRRKTNCCGCLLRAPGRWRKAHTHPEYTGAAPPFLELLLPRGPSSYKILLCSSLVFPSSCGISWFHKCLGIMKEIRSILQSSLALLYRASM